MKGAKKTSVEDLILVSTAARARLVSFGVGFCRPEEAITATSSG